MDNTKPQTSTRGFFITPDQKKSISNSGNSSNKSRSNSDHKKKWDSKSQNAGGSNFSPGFSKQFRNDYKKGTSAVKANSKQKCNETDNEKPKKTFDKKKWRLQRYSMKYKLQQEEERKKKVILRDFYKKHKDDKTKFDIKKIYEQYDSDDDDKNETVETNKRQEENENNLNCDTEEGLPCITEENQTPSVLRPVSFKKSAYRKAHEEYERIKKEKQNQKEEFLRKKAERREAIQQYKQKKKEKFRKLNTKTKKGQPIMKYRMEMLLEKLQKS